MYAAGLKQDKSQAMALPDEPFSGPDDLQTVMAAD